MNKKALFIAIPIILLCIAIIAGATFGLFTNVINANNHLDSGELEISLIRTDLEYCILNEEGNLEVTTITDDYDFSGSTEENVFGIKSENVKFAPCSYFDADMEIRNNGNVAFDYSVGIALISDSNDLTEQLIVTVTHFDGTTTTKKLSELVDGASIFTGTMKATETSQSFSVKVEFIDDIVANANLAEGEIPIDNDLAKNQSAVFDLVVTAVQETVQD